MTTFQVVSLNIVRAFGGTLGGIGTMRLLLTAFAEPPAVTHVALALAFIATGSLVVIAANSFSK